MNKLIASNGVVILVDSCDYDYLNQWSWCIIGKNQPARTEKGKTIYLSFEVAKLANIEHAQLLDHKDRNPLNNQRFNLRPASKSQNMMNRGTQVNNTSGFQGVDYSLSKKSWRARVKKDGRVIWQGYFNSPEEAGLKCLEKRKQFFGEFASEQID